MNIQKTKFIIFVFMFTLFFSGDVRAQDDQGFSQECHMALEGVKDEIDINSYSSVYTSCFKEVYVDTTVTKIGYFIFGEVYLEALKFFTIPFKLFVSAGESIINSSELFSQEGVSSFIVDTTSIIDDVKAQYSSMDSVVLAGSISSMVISLTFLINSIITAILIYVFVKIVWNFQKGNIEASKNFSTSIIRLISGIGLMAPFVYGYSLIQFILLGVIAFGSSIATMLFILVYLSFLNMEVDNLTQRDVQERIATYGIAAENIQELHKGKIISNLCTIRQTEEIISANIGDSNLIKYNNDHSEGNFINCLSSGANDGSGFVGGNVRANRNLNYCLQNYDSFYNFNDEEIKMNTPNNINCGEYSDSTNPILLELVNDLKNRAEDLAIKYHENECKLNYQIEQIGNNVNFKCIKLDSIGNFTYNETNNVDYFKVDNDTVTALILAEQDDIFKMDNLTFYETIRSQNQKVNLQVISELEDSGHLSGEFDRVKREQLKSLEKVIRNGWLHGFTIFMPKNLSSNIKSITENDYYTEYKNRIYEESLFNINYNATPALDISEGDFDLSGLYYNIMYLDYYIGADESVSSTSRAGDFFGSILNSTLTTFTTIEKESGMEMTERNMNNCIVNRNATDCNFGGGDVLSKFIINPIDSFYHTLNDMGDVIIGGFMGFSVANNIINSGGSRHNAIINNGFVLFSILMAVYLLATVFMVFTPFFIFISMVLDWLYKLIKSPFYIQLFVLWYVLPQDDSKEDTIDGDGNEEARMYKILGEMLLLPLFIIIGVLCAFSIMVVSYILISILSFIVFTMLLPSSGGLLIQLVYFFASYTLFLVLTSLIVFHSASQMRTAVDMIAGYFGFESLERENYFAQIENQIKTKLSLSL